MSSISAPTVKSKKRRKGGNLPTSSLHAPNLEEVGEAAAGIIIVETNEDLVHFESAERNQVPHMCCLVSTASP